MSVAKGSKATPPHAVLVIGRDTLTTETIASRLAADRCMHDTNATQARALAELVAARLEHEVLRHAFHEEPPDSILRMTAARLPHVTHDSAALACIMAIGDTAFFLNDYVRPTLVNPRVYARFYSDTIIHRAARDSIRAVFGRLAAHPEWFLTYHLDTIVIKRKHIAETAPLSSPSEEESPLVTNVLSKLGPRKLWPQIVESDFDFSIIMLDVATDSIYRALAIRVPKASFDPWFRGFVKRLIPIRFLDQALEVETRKKYPSLWWLGG